MLSFMASGPAWCGHSGYHGSSGAFRHFAHHRHLPPLNDTLRLQGGSVSKWTSSGRQPFLASRNVDAVLSYESEGILDSHDTLGV